MGNSTSNIRIDIEAGVNPAGFDATVAQMERVRTAGSKMASQYSGINAAVKEHSAAVTDTDRNITRLLDRYDLQGSKLRKLQADFKALDAAASGGRIAAIDDTRADAAYARLQKEIAAASAETAKFGHTSDAAALSAGQLRMATRQLPMQFTDITTSLIAGQPPMMVLMQQGGQLKDSFGGIGAAAKAMGGYILGLINPLTLTAAALGAGAVAWYKWGESAREAAEKSKAALAEAEKLAKLTKHMTPAEEVQDINKQIAALKEKNFWIEKNTPSMKAVMDSENSQLFSGASEERKRREVHLATVKANLESINNLERNRQDIEKQIAQQAEAESKRNQRGYRQSEAGKAERDYQQAIESATRHLAVLKSQAEATDRLTESEKKLIEFDAEHKPSRDKRIEQQRLAARAVLEEAAALDRAASIKRAASKADQEAAGIIDKARTTSAEYLNQLQFETSLLGKSATEVQKLTEQRRIELQLEKELLAIRNNSAFGSRNTNPEVDAAYQRAVAAAQASAEAAKAGAEVEIEARRRVATSWEFGAKEAIRKYDEAVKNSAAQSERLFSTAFKSAEDAITKAMMTGKLSVRDFANATIEEFYRIKVAQPMVSAGANFLGDLFGGMFGGGTSVDAGGGVMGNVMDTSGVMVGGGRASGGPVSPNTLYPVNERGPELLNYDGNDYLMMGGRGGYVKPLADASSSGTMSAAPSFTVNVFNAPAGTQVQQRRDGNGGMTLDVIIEQIEGGIARNVTRGTGALSGALTQTYGLNRAAGAY